MATNNVPRKISDRSIEQFAGPDLVREGTRGRGPLGMNASVHALGPVLLVSASGEAQEVERRPLAPGMPTLDFIFVEAGIFRYLVGSAWEECSGPLMIAPSGLPQHVRFITPWRFLVARIATDALRHFLPTLPEYARVFDTMRLPERAMAGYLASVGHDSTAELGESITASRLIVEMAGAVLRDRFGAGSPQGHPGVEIWGHAQAVIVEECTNPDFGPRALAQRVGCSLRRLQAEFTDRGTTVAGEIRRERARIAYALLRDPAQAGARMARIAERSGFGATSTMHRVIAESYGVTPTQLRGIAESSADPSVVG